MSNRPTKKQGTLEGWLRHPDPDWTTNTKQYGFGAVGIPGFSMKANKYEDGQISLELDGPLGTGFFLKHPIPKCGPKGLHVVLTWEKGSLKLYLNGDHVQTLTPPSSAV